MSDLTRRARSVHRSLCEQGNTAAAQMTLDLIAEVERLRRYYSAAEAVRLAIAFDDWDDDPEDIEEDAADEREEIENEFLAALEAVMAADAPQPEAVEMVEGERGTTADHSGKI